jgi:hypothetical protein
MELVKRPGRTAVFYRDETVSRFDRPLQAPLCRVTIRQFPVL